MENHCHEFQTVVAGRIYSYSLNFYSAELSKKKITKYNLYSKVCYLHLSLTGTPPFTVAWSKDGRELPDNDYYRCIIYGDGGVALRLSEVRSQDAGEYTCAVRNDFGVVSCNSLFAVQGLICVLFFTF